MTRVAIISDTHCFLDPRVADVVQTCDHAVHAGDIGTHDVLRSLEHRVENVIAVAGNNDDATRWAPEESHIAEKLPKVAELALPGGLLVVEHGERHGFHTPSHESLRASHPGARAIVYGHTHIQVCDQSEQPWVINPGAAGATRNKGGPSCIVLIATKNEWTLEVLKFTDS